ncbi:MAG: cation-translocating P-type ATPase [Clostridiales bacterium]|jgi:Ca2+-transporting ATPase|nr:cation-translocating P-type ATPase [Clostridiales bacterium]
MDEGYAVSAEDVLRFHEVTSAAGLDARVVEERLGKYGENKLEGKKEDSLFMKFLYQFKDFLVIILIIAAVISIAVGEYFDGCAIIAIVIFNAVLGVFQENKAGNALKSLRNMSSPQSKVLRGGRIEKISSNFVVPGDVVILEAGDYIPADLRLIESVNLKVDESALTGESIASEKDASLVLNKDTGLGDRRNSAYMGSVVTYGRGRGAVTATGMNTEMGKIAAMLTEDREEPTPLQVSLNSLGKTLGIVCIVVCAVIFGLGLLRGQDMLEMFMTAVSLAVAAIPEGLTMVVTVILALGMQRMVRSHAIIKRLSAVETLGSTTVICSDKTGTLTQNKMTVVKLYADELFSEVSGTGYEAVGGISEMNEAFRVLIEGAALCNDAVYQKENSAIIGDPTEGALLVLGEKAGFTKDKLNEEKPRIGEIPFDSDRRLMSTIHPVKNVPMPYIMYTKGAPDEILRRCAYIYKNGQILPITEGDCGDATAANAKFAENALRVLGVAFKYMPSEEAEEADLVFTGLIGMIDPPREEAKAAIDVCRKAGITVKMITGDHKATAMAIARQLGIMKNDKAISGREIDTLDDGKLREESENTHVFARVSPEHKVRLVNAIRANGNIAAMTGDGVNDAPSLKKADIGVAMGITGTDVAKEAADMILTDDNFASIVLAVEEGRIIYNNIRKVVGYLLSCNIGEILVIFAAMLFGWPIPLLPIHLLAINLITDAFPAFALGMEEKEQGLMDAPPRDPEKPIIDKKMTVSVLIQSISLTIGVLGSFMFAYSANGFSESGLKVGGTACFVTIVLGELFRAYTARSEKTPIFKMRWFSNKYLNQCVIVSIVFLLCSVFFPGFRMIFGNVPLTGLELLYAAAFALIPLAGGEVSKLVVRISIG